MEASSSLDVLLIEDLNQQRLQARYLAGALQRAGWRVQLVNLNQDADAIVTLAQRVQPRLIISSILFADRVEEHLALMTKLRASGIRAHCTLVGPLPTFASAELLAACPALDSPHLLPPLPLGEGVREPLRDDGIPTFQGYGFATVEASRGCYHACTFCLPRAFYRAQGMPYRLRSIPDLVDEIETLYRQGTRLFLFDDKQFLPPARTREKRVAAFADELDRRNLQIAFTLKCRADDVEETLFRRLQAMGLLRVYVGVESGCPTTLDLLNKCVTPQQNADALAMLDALGIVADWGCLLLHPWSTLETIETEIVFLHSLLPHQSTLFDFREVEVYPGTPLAQRLLAEGINDARPWPIKYAIADPRAELLRRISRVVFSPTGMFARIRDRLTEAWYALLLARRFQPEVSSEAHARELKSIAARVNGAAVEVWREMLAFARTADVHDAAEVNARAGQWAGCIQAICMEISVGARHFPDVETFHETSLVG